MKNLTRCVNQGNMDMKFKYLTLALAAAMATTGLTACGGDDDSNYANTAGDATNEDTGSDTGGDTGDTTDGDTTDGDTTDGDTTDGDTTDGDTTDGDTTDGDTTDGDTTDGDTTVDQTTDTEDNPGNSVVEGNQATKTSVVGQQYVRGSNNNFDVPNNPDKVNNASSTAVGYVNLQNDKMSNIVAARFTDEFNNNNTKVDYILGARPGETTDGTTDNPTLQNNNDADVNSNNLWTKGLVTVTEVQSDDALPVLTVNNQESKVAGLPRVTQISNNASLNGSNDVRIFGALANTTDAADTAANSLRYLVKDGDGNAVNLNTNFTTLEDEVEETKFDNVQYGRVTGNLESLSKDTIKNKTYIMAKFADKNFNGNTTQTDLYFYRGNNETAFADMPKSGDYQYAGHALMYGIDNSLNNSSIAGLESNAPDNLNKDNAGIGNFVQATARFTDGAGTVEGSVYNIWELEDKVDQVDLVAFNGDIVGNSIKGTAGRTYVNAGAHDAAFKGSFYGQGAAEMGGSFNSVESGYDKSTWGGVFGAEQLAKTPAPVVVPPVELADPEFQVEVDADVK